MQEDKQQFAKQTWEDTGGDLKSRTKAMLNFQKDAVQQHKLESQIERDNLGKNVYIAGLNSNNHSVAEECNKTFRTIQVAEGIRKYFAKPENGGHDYSDWGDEELIDSYEEINPDRKEAIENYRNEQSEICDPSSLYYEMNWDKPDYSEGFSYNPFRDSALSGAGSVNDQITQGIDNEYSDGAEGYYSEGNGGGTLLGNILGAGFDIVDDAGNVIYDAIDSGNSYLLKKLGLMSDEEIEENEQRKQAFREKYATENFIPGVDDESITYHVARELEELISLIASKGATSPITLRRFKFLTDTKWGKRALNLIRKGISGADDMARLDIMEGETPSAADLTAGGVINILLGGKGKNFADIGAAEGSMYKSQLEETLKMLKEDYGINLDIKALGDFMNRRFSGGSKQKIAEDAGAWAKTAEDIVDALLSFSKEKVNSETTTKILNAIAEKLESRISAAGETVEDEVISNAVKRIRSLIRDDNNYSLSEIKNAMRELSKSDITPFKKNKFGETAETGSKEFKKALRERYDELKKTLEDEAARQGLGDLKNLNKEIYISRAIEKGLAKKDVGEQAAKKVSSALTTSAITSSLGGLASSLISGNPTLGIIVGGAAGFGYKAWKKLLENTSFRTRLSRLIYDFAGEEKKALIDRVESNGKKQLEESSEKKLQELLKKIDKSWMEENLPKILGGVSDLTKAELGQGVANLPQTISNVVDGSDQ